MRCDGCPDMRPGSSFDGRHLYCERHRVWTNLLDPRWVGHCLDEGISGMVPNDVDKEEEDE